LTNFILTPADTAELPWPTTPGDWYVCLHPDLSRAVYIEHRLIIAILADRGLPVIADPPELPGQPDGARWACNWDHNYAMHANALGVLMFGWLDTDPPRQDGLVHGVGASRLSLDMRAGFFGGRVFIFLPRPELEGPL